MVENIFGVEEDKEPVQLDPQSKPESELEQGKPVSNALDLSTFDDSTLGLSPEELEEQRKAMERMMQSKSDPGD